MEAQKISIGLCNLGQVIAALATKKDKFIPYRNSVLTYLNKDGLGGTAKTLFISTNVMIQLIFRLLFTTMIKL